MKATVKTQIHESTLTDGSKVYDVHFRVFQYFITFNCESQRQAEELSTLLNTVGMELEVLK